MQDLYRGSLKEYCHGGHRAGQGDSRRKGQISQVGVAQDLDLFEEKRAEPCGRGGNQHQVVDVWIDGDGEVSIGTSVFVDCWITGAGGADQQLDIDEGDRDAGNIDAASREEHCIGQHDGTQVDGWAWSDFHLDQLRLSHGSSRGWIDLNIHQSRWQQDVEQTRWSRNVVIEIDGDPCRCILCVEIGIGELLRSRTDHLTDDVVSQRQDDDAKIEILHDNQFEECMGHPLVITCGGDLPVHYIPGSFRYQDRKIAIRIGVVIVQICLNTLSIVDVHVDSGHWNSVLIDHRSRQGMGQFHDVGADIGVSEQKHSIHLEREYRWERGGHPVDESILVHQCGDGQAKSSIRLGKVPGQIEPTGVVAPDVDVDGRERVSDGVLDHAGDDPAASDGDGTHVEIPIEIERQLSREEPGWWIDFEGVCPVRDHGGDEHREGTAGIGRIPRDRDFGRRSVGFEEIEICTLDRPSSRIEDDAADHPILSDNGCWNQQQEIRQ